MKVFVLMIVRSKKKQGRYRLVKRIFSERGLVANSPRETFRMAALEGLIDNPDHPTIESIIRIYEGLGFKTLGLFECFEWNSHNNP